MKIAETVDGQNGDGSKSHAPNGTADGQMGDGSSSNVQNNDDEGHKGDDNSKVTGSRDQAHDKKDWNACLGRSYMSNAEVAISAFSICVRIANELGRGDAGATKLKNL